MRTHKVSTLISLSVKKTKENLFQGFSLRKWLVLIFIAAMAGSLTGGGGCNVPDIPRDQQNVAQTANQQADAVFDQAEQSAPVTMSDEEVNDAAVFSVLIAALIGFVVFIVAVLFFAWLSSRFKFVWYDSVVTNTFAVKEPFQRFKPLGNSFFKWHIFFTVVIFLVIMSWVGMIGLSLAGQGALNEGFEMTMDVLGRAFLAPTVVLVLFLILFGISYVAIEDFIIPIMVADQTPFLPALKSFFSLLGRHKGDFFGYLFIRFGLGILTNIISTVLTGLVLIALAIVLAVIFGILYLLFVVLIKVEAVFTILAILLSIPSLVVTIAVLLAPHLPFAMFYRYFSICYLSSLGDKYQPVQLSSEEK